MLTLKPFQREDLARAALVNGLVLGWDTGLGKTLAMFLWALLKLGRSCLPLREEERLRPNGTVLLVAPGDLHDRIIRKAAELFGIRITLLESQDAFRAQVRRIENGRPILDPGFYLTSYTQLGQNGVRPWPDPDDWEPQALRDWLCIGERGVREFYDGRGSWYAGAYAMLGATPDMTESLITNCHYQVTKGRNQEHCVEEGKALCLLRKFHSNAPVQTYEALEQRQRDWLTRETVRRRLEEWRENDKELRNIAPRGQPPYKVKCVYSPTLADEAWNAFDACIIDEGVKIKGDHTLLSLGVRQMAARYRLVLTATPIKNRLPDFFWLAAWAVDAIEEPTPRFPYLGTVEDKTTFAKTFLVSERNLSKEEELDRPFKKLTAQVCNIHALWKQLGPLVLRRRKQDLGEDNIVPCRHHVLRVPMGSEQAQVVRYHLDSDWRDRNGRPAIGPQLQALRIAAAAHHSPLLAAPSCIALPAEHGIKMGHRRHTPKLGSVMEVITRCLEKGEQVLVGAAFNDPLDAVGALLRQAGVDHVALDGRSSPKRRGELARAFELGQVPVALGGVESVAEGHDFWRCSNVLLFSFSWAFDKFEQFINRAWRLASRRPVNVWCVIADGTMDRRLEASVFEKRDAAELVLDGRLLSAAAEEVSLAELLRGARAEFQDGQAATTLCEEKLALGWPAVRDRLAAAALQWQYAEEGGSKLILPAAPNFQLPTPNSQPTEQIELLFAA